jgi:hypothetical protein
LILTVQRKQAIAAIVRFHWCVCGQQIPFISKEKVGDINEKLSTGVIHMGAKPVGHAQRYA